MDITHNKVTTSSFKDEGLESSTQAENHSKLEDQDSFNPTEPPPLDWRSDSSSEACSLGDIEEPGSFSMGTPLDELSDYGAHNTSFTPTDLENLPSQEAEEELPNQEAEDRTNNTQRMNKSTIPEPLEKNLEKTRQKPTKNRQQHDLDHSHIQDLLHQLQLFHPTPASKDPSPEPEPERSTLSADCVTENLSSSSLVPDISASQTCAEGSTVSGLLFTVSHQRELLELLEDPEPQEAQEFQESQEDRPIFTEQTTESHTGNISQLRDCQTRYITRSGEADEMVSVSYGSDIWHSPFQDELMVSVYSEGEVMEQWQQSKCVLSDELASRRADMVGETLFIVQKLKSVKWSNCVTFCSFSLNRKPSLKVRLHIKTVGEFNI